MNKTIGVVAHVDAGKTTLIEQLLYNSNTISAAGRVDKQSTFLDYHDIEKQRGITVFSEQAIMQYKDSTIHLIDTPGHVDFSSEMERSLQVLDCCILVISGASGVQAHTQTLWKLLRKNNIPTILFINKLDMPGLEYNKLLDDIHAFMGSNTLLLAKPCYNDQFELTHVDSIFAKEETDEDTIAEAAEYDEKILEKYLEGDAIGYDELLNSISDITLKCKAFPILCGSTLKNIGVKTLLDAIDKIIITNYDKNAEFKGLVYKIRHDDNLQKLTFIKVLSGTVNVKDTLTHTHFEEPLEEKVNQIRVYNGNKFTNVQKLEAGEYGAIIGLSESYIHECFGDDSYYEISLEPALKSRVIFDEKYNYRDILKIFELLTEEDPTLNVSWVSEIGQIQINIMGFIQLEILKHEVLERFNTEVDFGTPEVVYMETVKEATEGMGHFEPYRHFSEITLRIEPAPRGSGISYVSECSLDRLQTRWQRNVEKLIVPACERGIMTGSKVTDVKITLIDGRSHPQYTAGGDFKEATFRAVRKALVNGKDKLLLLEPYYSFTITVANELSGKVITDITKMFGTFDPPYSIGDNSIITGRAPVSTFIDYPNVLAGFSKGKGLVSFNLDGYDVCHNQEEAIERVGYNHREDEEFSHISVYCSKGRVYYVE